MPVNANEAEARRRARFFPIGHSPGDMPEPRPIDNPEHPLTLDLRRACVSLRPFLRVTFHSASPPLGGEAGRGGYAQSFDNAPSPKPLPLSGGEA